MTIHRPGLGIRALGELDVDVLTVVWSIKNGATVKDVFERLYGSRRLAYTTVMTVMCRLTKKGILKQDKSTTPYVYSPRVSKEELAFSIIDHVVDRLLDGSPSFLLDYVSENHRVSP